MKTSGVIAAVLAMAAVAGCEDKSKRLAFDGEYFRAKSAKVDKQRDVFTVTVSGVSRSTDGARQAAYHEGVSYCVLEFGTSEIEWGVDPLNKDVPLQVRDDTISFQGTCPQAQKA